MDAAPKTGRGERWFVAQIILLGILVLIPNDLGGLSALPRGLALPGGLVSAAGVVIGLLSVVNLGTNLTPFPRPKDDATLTQTGLYGLVRHPIYFGILLGAVGWSFFRQSIPALVVTIILFAFFDRKATLEEGWLTEKFADYKAYQRRVRKLIPFIY